MSEPVVADSDNGPDPLPGPVPLLRYGGALLVLPTLALVVVLVVPSHWEPWGVVVTAGILGAVWLLMNRSGTRTTVIRRAPHIGLWFVGAFVPATFLGFMLYRWIPQLPGGPESGGMALAAIAIWYALGVMQWLHALIGKRFGALVEVDTESGVRHLDDRQRQ